MAYAALGKLKKNSPEATLTAGIDDTTGTIPVDHLEYFHDEDGTLIVKGIVLGPDTSTITETEEITITGASGTTGAGNLTGGTRGVNADGTVGAAKAWDSGTVIKVTYTTGIHNQIKDNFAKIQTTAAMSVYVDSAATGTGDGTSWTDAFTTIQGAIDSLPSIVAHNCTIYIRKGSTPYDENIVVDKSIANAATIKLIGEYYWYGECAAAATPSATKFNVTATNGSNIAAGDLVLVRDGIADYIYTTVVATVDKGSNVWEVEITDALPTGNIGSGDYYEIVKTKIEASSGVVLTAKCDIRINGLEVNSLASYATRFYGTSSLIFDSFLLGCGGVQSAVRTETHGGVTLYRNYLYASTTGKPLTCFGTSVHTVGNSVANANVIATGGNSSGGVHSLYGGNVNINGLILDVQAGIGIQVYNCRASVSNTTISPSGKTAAATGMQAIDNAAIIKGGGITNNATTPENPASSSDGAYIH